MRKRHPSLTYKVGITQRSLRYSTFLRPWGPGRPGLWRLSTSVVSGIGSWLPTVCSKPWHGLTVPSPRQTLTSGAPDFTAITFRTLWHPQHQGLLPPKRSPGSTHLYFRQVRRRSHYSFTTILRAKPPRPSASGKLTTTRKPFHLPNLAIISLTLHHSQIFKLLVNTMTGGLTTFRRKVKVGPRFHPGFPLQSKTVNEVYYKAPKFRLREGEVAIRHWAALPKSLDLFDSMVYQFPSVHMLAVLLQAQAEQAVQRAQHRRLHNQPHRLHFCSVWIEETIPSSKRILSHSSLPTGLEPAYGSNSMTEFYGGCQRCP